MYKKRILFYLILQRSGFLEAFIRLGHCPLMDRQNKRFPCEKVNEDFSVNQSAFQKKLQPLAFLPTYIENDRRRTNLFAFNFSNLNCLRMAMNCNNMKTPDLLDLADLFFYCYNNIQSNIYRYGGPGYKLYYKKNGSLNLWPSETYVKQRCPELIDESDFNYVTIYEPQKYFCIWGCGELNKTHHDEGMWIFGNQISNISEILELVKYQMNLNHNYEGKFLLNSFTSECNCTLQTHDHDCYYSFPKYVPLTRPPIPTSHTKNGTQKDKGGFYFSGMIIGCLGVLSLVILVIFRCSRTPNRIMPVN